MLLVYNYVLLKISTWYSKHVEESNNIWRISNIQCITLVVLYGRFTYSLSCQTSWTFQSTIFSYGQTDGPIGMLSTIYIFISLHEQRSRCKNMWRWTPTNPRHDIYSHFATSSNTASGTHTITHVTILDLTRRQKAAVRPNRITPCGCHKQHSVPMLW